MNYAGGSAGTGAALAATGAAADMRLALYAGVLLMLGALCMLAISGNRRRADRRATRS